MKFNETGRIVHHEDIWGLKEVLEGMVPVFGPLYYFQRKGIGAVSGLVSRSTVMRHVPAVDEEMARLNERGSNSRAGSPAISRKASVTGLALENITPAQMANLEGGYSRSRLQHSDLAHNNDLEEGF